MLGAIAKRLFGTANERFLKTLNKSVAAINAVEPDLAALSDDDLRARTRMFRDRLAAGESLDDLLVDAFATVREAAKRTLGQRHFDVQLKGGVVLHRGMIAEMKTGEGKTLVATLAVYLNALRARGCTSSPSTTIWRTATPSGWARSTASSASRSAASSTACPTRSVAQAYAADVTYGTNNEFGFDYLRDNMKFRLDDMVQRPFNFAIVDEVDSILIDEARTPLDHLRPGRGLLRALHPHQPADPAVSTTRISRRTRRRASSP